MNGEIDSKFRIKVGLVFFIFCLLFFLVLAKAFYVQVVNSNRLIAYLKDQMIRETKVYPNRGIIYDRNGGPLAINEKTYSIFTIPKNLKSKWATLRKLKKIVPKLSMRKLKSRLKGRKRYTWLARKIKLTEPQVDRIKNLKGVYIESVPKRIYPNGDLLAQTLGFVGVDNIGLAGIEYRFDTILKGRPRVIRYSRDAKGRAIKHQGLSNGLDSQSVILSIDRELQEVAQRHLKNAVIKHEAVKGGIGVMDVSTGAVLAMANYPTFNPNKLKSSTAAQRKLSFISDPFEPGSIFKAVTVASAFEHKVARVDTHYYCEMGKFKVGDHIINEADKRKKFEWLSVNEIMKYSSNIGTTKMAFDLTYPKLLSTMKKMGVGRKTGISLPGESRGILVGKKNVSPLSLSNISFGQGVATTGIQMLSIYSAIASGGVYRSPVLLKKEEEHNTGVRVLRESTANDLTNILIDVVENGSGTNAKISGFKIAGKTSTAQRPSENGGYKGYVSGFIGYPVNVKQKFVIFVYIDHPQAGGYYGNTVAAPVFKEVAQFILYRNKEYQNMKEEEQISQFVADNLMVKKSSIKRESKSKNIVPNFIGLDKRSAEALAKKYKLTIRQRGMGLVVSQGPMPGGPLKEVKEISLNFAPPYYE